MRESTRRHHRWGVMPGDGVGPALVQHALQVLEEVASTAGFSYDLVRVEASADRYLDTGELLTERDVETLRGCESLLFGAVGDPRLPEGVIERGVVLGLTERLGLTVGTRTAFLHHADLSPLKGLVRGDIDIVLVRDLSEGELAIPGGRVQPDSECEAAVSTVVHTRRGVERALDHAAGVALTRRRRVLVVSQSNTIAPHRLWQEAASRLARARPEIQIEHVYPDHALMMLVNNPSSLDVVVTTCWLGGTMSDLLGAVVGGIGVVGSSRLNPESGFGMFEPAHGSAPRWTGRDRVSPMATFNALAMMLDHCGERLAADRVRAAVDAVLAGGATGLTTRDGPGTARSSELVLEALASAASRGGR